MSYSVLPDRRMPYDNDGTVVKQGSDWDGILSTPTGAMTIEWNDYDYVTAGAASQTGHKTMTWLFFPEQREVTAYYGVADFGALAAPQGSNDTTNGMDGTWETATLSGGGPTYPPPDAYAWRSGIKPVSFTGGKRTIRVAVEQEGSRYLQILHVYGEKVAGQTPDDLIFIDHDTTPGVEYQAPEDFGDRPLGTTEVREWRVKNASATKTANSIDLQCNDSDFAISTDGTTWVTTINISSLAAGAESATMYVRNTTPSPGGLLGPRYARIVATVGSWT